MLVWPAAAEDEMKDPFFKRLLTEWRLDSVGVAIFVSLTALAYFLQFEPAMRDRDAVRAGIAELSDKRQTISKLQQTTVAINNQIKSLNSAQEHELKLLPPADVNDRLSAYSALAQELGLQIEALEPGEATASGRYSTVPIRMNGRGTYPQFARFIRKLREKLPDTSVTEMNISGGGDGA